MQQVAAGNSKLVLAAGNSKFVVQTGPRRLAEQPGSRLRVVGVSSTELGSCKRLQLAVWVRNSTTFQS